MVLLQIVIGEWFAPCAPLLDGKHRRACDA